MKKHLLLLLVLICAQLGLASPLLATPPISLNPTNPHYFLFRGQPTVLVASTEHYGSVVNLDFNYITYLNEIQSKNLNYTRVFGGSYVEYQGWFGIPQNTLAPASGRFLAPWLRSSTPGYMNGGNKFDLSQFDPAYFTRLQDFVSQASSRGIVVEVSLFCNYYTTQLWQLSPLYEGNNINGINGGGGDGALAYSLNGNGNLQAIQDAYVKKMVTALNGYDNVVYEICNELYNTSTYPWQQHMADVITQTEATLPNKHLISQNVANGSSTITSPDTEVSIFNYHYATDDAPGLNASLPVVIGFDETGTSGSADIIYRHQGWEFLMSGGGLFDNLDYSFTVAAPNGPVNLPSAPSGGDPALRVQLGILRSFFTSIDFLHMAKDSATITGGVPSGATTYVMSEPGQQYAVFLEGPNGNNQANLVANLPAATYVAQWVNTQTGNIDKSETFTHPGGSRTISSPTYTDDIALRITNTNGTGGGTSPVITSSSTASGMAGTAFSYQITATNSPTSYGASGLPSGLSINTGTGLISGTPTTPGTGTVTLSATNGSGTSTELLTLTITGGSLPSPWTDQDIGAVGATGSAGYSGGTFTVTGSGADIWGTADAFHYVYQSVSGDCSITARVASVQNTNASAKAAVMIRSDLTAGSAHAMLDVSPGGGIEFIYRTTANAGASRAAISGTAPYWARVTRAGNVFTGYASTDGVNWTQVGAQTITMGTSVYIGLPVCSHVAGTLCTATFDNISVTGGSGGNPPVINSSASVSGTVSSAFSYQITATNSPTSYSATGLPGGLTVNTSTGVISGTPTASGTSSVTIGATNASGTGTATLVLTINAAGSAPVITSSVTATGTVGGAFSYQITASNSPTSYNATGLPAGLSVNASTGVISGTPTVAGTSNISLSATNASGTGTATLALTVNASGGTASIGMQFVGSGTALAATDSAGISPVTQTHWNALTGASFTNQALVDSTGASSAAKLTGGANGTYFGGGSSASPAGNSKLASGELFNGWPSSPTLTVSNIPYAHYDVYVYAGIDSGGRAETVGLTPSGGAAQYYSFTTEGGGSAWTAATSTWNGTGTQPSLPTANYVHYTGLTASSFTMAWGAPGNGGLNGIQIVSSGTGGSAPGITSSLTATGTVNSAFSYQITASNSPTSYNATGLPAGLSVNTSTGVISGTPTVAGTSNISLSATNASGTGTATLALTVNASGGTASIGIQFVGSGTALAATDSAGLSTAAQAHWNALAGASFTSQALVDSTGASTTATLSGSANGTYFGGGSSASPAGNAKLASGELFNGWPGAPTLTVSNIPYAKYDVYVYAGIDSGGRNQTVSLTPSGGTAQYYSFTTEGGGPAWTAATSTWNGSGTAPGLPSANYVHYTNITTSSFTMAWGAPGNGGMNGVQIVPVP